MDCCMFRRKYLLGCLGNLGGLKATVGNRVTTWLSLYPHSFFCSFLFLSARVFFSLAGYAQKHVSLSQAEV